LQTRQHPFADALPLKLRDSGEDVHLELTRSSCGVYPLRQTDESNAERLQFIQQRDQVPQVASETIQTPADKHVESSPPRILQQRIECRTTVLRSTHSTVYKFGC
jgi:hypothetical protein